MQALLWLPKGIEHGTGTKRSKCKAHLCETSFQSKTYVLLLVQYLCAS